MEESEQGAKIIENLEALNKRLAWQNSFWAIFSMGILYGIGFFIGSAIIATIALGFLGPWFAQIQWVRSTFEMGLFLLHH